MTVNVIYLDQWLLVLNKPTGLLSVPGIGPEKADCLASRAAAEYPGLRIVHRLDRDTSGVIIMARDAEAHRRLSRQFEQRQTKKSYIAVADGLPVEDEGSIDLPMRKDMDTPPLQLIDHVQGKAALTHWRVLDRGADRARIELRPHTGRSHQLRLHLREIGHPILGDDLYSPEDVRAKAERLMLHSLELSVAHPMAVIPMTFRADCPF